jgi:fatty-acid desaturase
MRDESVINQPRTGVNWSTAITMVVFHAAAVWALFNFTWAGLFAAVVLWWVSGSLGIGMGFHRLLTHRGYKTPKAVEYFLTACGLLALEGGAINWVATHRIHHSHTDAPGDPHTPRDGKWWSHMGWILQGTSQQYPEPILRRYAPDLMRDPVHVQMNRFFYVPLVAVGLACFALGGLPVLLWGVFLRVTVGLHATWLVNSATHLWGSRRFATDDDSTNNWLIALVTFGEGWHNNHHAHPVSAKHGLRWYEFDLNWYGIRALELLGLAKNVKSVSADAGLRDAEGGVMPEALSKAA